MLIAFLTAKLTAIFCDTLARVDGVLKNVKECDTLKNIIVASSGTDSELQAMKEKGKLPFYHRHNIKFFKIFYFYFSAVSYGLKCKFVSLSVIRRSDHLFFHYSVFNGGH